MNSDKNFVPAPAQFEPPTTPRAPDWMTAPTLTTALVERIRAGASLEEVKQFYAFMREIEQHEAAKAAATDFAAMQAELPPIPKLGAIDIGRGKPQKYMRWEDIARLIKPTLAKYGWGLSFRILSESETHVEIKGILEHKSGILRETTRRLPLDKSGSKNIVQAYGSTQSYAMRYVAIALLALAAEGEDDDASKLGPQTSDEFFITEEQANYLAAECDLAELGTNQFCQAFGIEKLSELPRRRFDEAKRRLENRIELVNKEKDRDDAANP